MADESKPPFPPFTLETAKIKVKAAQDAWNTKTPDKVKMAYTPDTIWRNRDQFLQGRDAVREFLADKWATENGYRLRKELFAFTDNKIAVQFWYEWHNERGQWWRTYGLEDWTFAENGLMRKRQMSGNDVRIGEEERWFKDGVDVNSVDIEEPPYIAPMTEEIDRLRREIAQRESELADLKSQLAVAESQKRETEHSADAQKDWKWPLKEDEYERYSRQMIVPNFGLQGQLRLREAKVLLVGAGGLGCPAAAYLAGAGVGVLGLIDGDTVEVSNLHRQVAHSTSRVGMTKVESAITYLKEYDPPLPLPHYLPLNPTITYHAHQTHLTPQNAASILSSYDLVLDCTDHPSSRYLISDACVLLGKPLVSASAFQTSGQLLVLHSPPGRGPCYRCVFPKPPPPESVVGCGEGGIIGPVVGTMGVLQALEAIKLITRGGLESPSPSSSSSTDAAAPKQITMLLFSSMAENDNMFRTVRIRGKRDDCFACGSGGGDGALTLAQMQSSLDYVQFCGVAQPVKLLHPAERIPVSEYARIAADRGSPHLLIDVREKEHFGLSNIPGSVNVPISLFMRPRAPTEAGTPDWMPADLPHSAPIYVVCRVGNDSQIATQKLKELGLDRNGERFVGDIDGGLRAWRKDVDPTLPFI
ncbi:Adenylyltransferase and sulfurtransferase UBA4 [Beauveria bassiana D1-5]|uniref:Adenylyltransferase and sulfurtransferase uba4 n=1 Tax=Beauveria bassiana D1-5 TaxID=1245745 RepID=A0A0A2VR80_BEABA|nr:Adenylyltransferase and sulfurtransferase UBA4 [Beauveria bassiana D1-5]